MFLVQEIVQAIILVALASATELSSLAQRRCFTEFYDFHPGALHGKWSGITPSEWDVEEGAERRRRYGNMTCSFEEEDKACGRTVGGLWEGVGSNPQAIENAKYAQSHVVLRPNKCSLGVFNARRLVGILSGGRTLHINGDSTMRQLYGAIICSIPLSLVAPEKPRIGKGDNMPRLDLVGGGRVMLGIFPDGASWYNKGGSKHSAGTFSPSQMADVLFGKCPENDICVNRPTLHGGASNEVAEPAALRDPEFHQALKPLASSNGTQGWSIALAPTLQHFYPPEGLSQANENLGQCSGGGGGGGGGNSGAYTEGAASRLFNATKIGHESSGCLARVCPNQRDVALTALQRLNLPLALFSADLQYHHGLAHITAAPRGGKIHQDCTHWCAPGMSDAVASVVLSLIDLYNGSRPAFVEAMLPTMESSQERSSLETFHQIDVDLE